MTRLICVRHGPVSVHGVCYGRLDVETTLPPAALTELIALVKKATQGKHTRLWVSPAERCRQLAAPLAAELGLSETIEPRLQELSFGDWEGRRWKDLGSLPEFAHWMKNWRQVAPPGGETLLEFSARVDAWQRCLRDFDVHIAITHAGVIRQLSTSLWGKSWEEALRFPIGHMTPYEFVDEGS